MQFHPKSHSIRLLIFFRCKLVGADNLGLETNGTFDGGMGMLQDKTADLFLYNLSPYLKKDFFEHSNPCFSDG